MYAKCGALEKAQEVFDELPVRNVVSWNALITAYIQHGHGEEALRCFEEMQVGGFSPDAFTFACILKACGITGALDTGQEVYTQIVREHLLEKDIVIGNALVDMYAKCGALDKAQEVFDRLSTRDVVSWNGLIGGYAEHGLSERALSCFEEMQARGFHPNAVTFICALKACGSLGALDKGQDIHDQIVRACLLGKHVTVANALIVMYAKCDALEKAKEVFDELPVRNVVSWTALIAGYCQNGPSEEALNYFERMQLGGFSPDLVTFACILKACGSIGAVERGQEIHAQIVREHSLEKHVMVANALIDMYCKCCALEKAQEVFGRLPFPDIVSWNVLIAGFSQHGHDEETFMYLARMLLWGFSPNEFTFACILKACGNTGAYKKGLEIHAQIVGERSLQKHIVIGTALVDMYAKCGAFGKGQDVLHELPVRDTVLWNALITGYVHNKYNEEALECFECMQCKGFSPDAVTLACILKACGGAGAANNGQKIHASIVKRGTLREDAMVGNALVDMYANCGMIVEAQDVFDNLLECDVVSWNVLIAGYVQLECGEEALNCFEWMQVEGFSPDAITFACVLKACGSIGLTYKGQKVHAEIVRHGFLGKGLTVDSALVVMYVNCGMLEEAQDAFDNSAVRDVILWSALMVGYAQFGNDETVLLLFDKMIEEGIEPDAVTLTIILYTCSHGGLLDEGLMCFKVVSQGYGLIPTLEHHACMVDLLGRVGHLDKAVALIKRMPFSVNLAMWRTLLGACHKWIDMKLGKWAFEHALQLDDKDGGAYVCMSNIYAAAGQTRAQVPKMYEGEGGALWQSNA